MSHTRVAIFGAGGRMGRALIQALHAAEGAGLSAAFEHAGSSLLGLDAAILAGLPAGGIRIAADVESAIAATDVAIDFSTPQSTCGHVAAAADAGVACVVGTTGLTESDEARLGDAALRIPIVYAANFSVGLNLLADLVARAAGRLGEDFDIEILEMHHRDKVDAPSGSALLLGRAAANGRGVRLDDIAVRGRDGAGARPKGAIGFAALRGGDVAGDHTVIFAGEAERLELTHRAGGRGIFARGALRAALWAIGKPPAVYSMRDVLGLDA